MHLPGPLITGKVLRFSTAAERPRSVLLLSLSLCFIFQSHSGFAQHSEPILVAATELPDAPSSQISGRAADSTLTGTIVDSDGATIPNARITLIRTEQSASSSNPSPIVTLTGADGRFTFTGLSSGSYQLSIIATRFTPHQIAVTLHPGESLEVPAIALALGTSIEVQVTASQQEVAQAQIEEQEKQRVLGIIPNFFVSYALRPLPLTARQKFELSWKSALDPTAFAGAAFVSGIQQADNAFPSWGQGVQGYGKRFGAAYGNVLVGTMLSSAILPSLFKQDPRFFYKAGTVRERIKYSFAMAVLCRGDNGHWQFNYSGILGSAGAAGLSNLYYPAADRDGAWLTIGNTALGVAGSVVSNIFQEFLLPRLTPHKPQPNGTQP